MKKPKFCFTSDFDGATRTQVKTLLDIYTSNEIPATLFMGLDDGVKPDSEFEIALHPNFYATADYSYTIEKTKQKYQNAVGIRPHGLLNFYTLFEIYKRFGFLYDSTTLVHNEKSGPYMTHGIVELPIFFIDYVQLKEKKPLDISYLYFHDGIHIFTFHPIHVHENPDIKRLLEDVIAYAKKKTEILTCKEIAERVVRQSNIETQVYR